MIKELSDIHKKIDDFIRKYYKNQIIRGILILILLSLSAYLILVSSEFLGHFTSLTRTVGLFSVILVLLIAFVILILKPTLALYNIGKSLSPFQVDQILRVHFPELKDQLRNILELERMNKEPDSSELIKKAIEQKSKKIKPIPFVSAINIQANIKYVKIIGLPLVILSFLYFYSPKVLSEGTERILHFNQFYQEPNPFRFVIENDSLSIKKGENLKLIVHTEGEYVPYPIYVEYGGTEYLLQKKADNLFSYNFKNVNQNFRFYLKSEDYKSKAFQVKALASPKILNFSIKITAPEYTQIESQTVDNTGDLIVPEGSKVNWTFKTKDIEKLWFLINDSITKTAFPKKNSYLFSETILSDLNYSVNIANQLFEENEILKYSIQVIPDEYPSIITKSLVDSIHPTVYYFKGQANDDYGIEKINFCYQIEGQKEIIKTRIPIDSKAPLQDFYYAYDFKSIAQQGKKLNYYFEVWDNDGINGSKKSSSRVFQFYLPSQKEVEKLDQENTKSMQSKLEQTQELAKDLQKDVKNLKKDLVNKESNSWQINKKLSQISEKQSKLEQLMKEVSKENKKNNELLKNLSQEDQKLLDKQKKIENLLSQLMDDEMKKLMEEINKLMNDFDKDKFNELTEKMDMSYKDLSEQLDRNLEQLKRFEVEKKMEQAIDELDKLSKEQEQLSEETKTGDSPKEALEKKQKEQEAKMKDIADKVNESMKKNQELEEPMNLEDVSQDMKDIQESMKESSESLQKGKSGKASKQQKSSSEKMSLLSKKMRKMMDKASQEQQQLDMEALRQIIENLTDFSFSQEKIMLAYRGLRYKDPKYIELFNKQTKIKENFKIIEDSLYALAKTQPMIASTINKELLNINRELKKTEKALDDRRAGKAQSSQQFVMTSANNLALLLSDILEQMKNQQSESKCKKSGNCNKPGSGKPKPGFGQPKKQAQSMKQQMKDMLNQLKNGKGKGGKNGNKPSKKALGKMIAEQEKMQKMLSDLSNSQGISPKAAKELKEIKNISKQVEDDLIQQNITPTTLKRQELILTRLLEAENSEFKREQDNKRESNSAKNPQISKPKDIFKKQEENLIGNDILFKNKVKLKQFYKEKYKNYLININD